MPRGRHSLPAPPPSDLPLMLVGLVVALVAVAAVWVVDDSLALRVGVTAVLVAIACGAAMSLRSTHRVGTTLWQEAIERRREVVEVEHELSQLQRQHVELLLELRTLRTELAAVSEETTRSLQAAAEQRAVVNELLMPRETVADAVYPSLHLPLVRAAFAAEVRPEEPVVAAGEAAYPETDDSGGSEPFPPRQLLDLTASEIARLRPAN